jgi:anti-sigma regulatory factor (Ser/Thr protein kinase)
MEGYSTAPDSARAMGFGAGMGLPNIKKHVDKLDIETTLGKGTKVTIYINY